MGLDMYLSKKTYLKNWKHDEKNDYSVIARNNKKKIKHINKKRVSYVIEEVGYWRKANHIHKWFVENCQGGEDDCRNAYVSAEQLRELQHICSEVKKYLDTCEKEFDKEYADYYTFNIDEEVLEELLPTQTGFFFGGTEYGRWYYESLKETINMIDDAFEGEENFGYGVDFEYQSSW